MKCLSIGSLVRGVAAAASVGSALLCAAPAQAQTLTTRQVVTGLVRPNFVTFAPNDPTRIFILEKQGRIRIAQINQTGAYTLLPTPFLDIDPIVTGGTTTSSEQGLLGLAFHPNYPTDPRFFVYYTGVAGAGDEFVAAYTVSANPNIANTTGDIIATWDDPQTNHNGGWIAFGPDGYFYMSCGDGGNANDVGTGHTEPGGNAQDITSNRLGKIMRIDVNGDDFPADTNRDYKIPPTNPFFGTANDGEIWAYGLRNAWRPSFDRGTGNLWIPDVGQNAVEEINFQPAGSSGSVAGRNYGWRCYEGNTLFTNDAFCTALGTAGLTFPIYTYTHSVGCSITGGYVYRGCAIPSLQGTYFFADYCTAFIQTFRYNGSVISSFTDRTTELAPGGGLGIASITSFGEDFAGELYICDQDGGEVFKIVPRAGTFTDCNADGIPDTCQSLTPSFSGNPGTTTKCPAGTATFSSTASGATAVTYSWQWKAPASGSFVTIPNGAVAGLGTVSGAGTSTLTISNLALAANASSIRAVATTTCGASNSTPASLFVSTTGCKCNPADICGVGATYDNGAVDIGPDFALTIEDFLNFLSAFGDSTGCPGTAPCNPADICGVGATYDNGAVDIGPDGDLTIEDFLNFLSAFGDSTGCP